MSDYAIWKALHLLHVHGQPDDQGRPALPLQILQAAGIDCYGDTLFPLLQAGVIWRLADGRFALSPAANTVIAHCVVANKRWAGGDVRVDQPQAFIVMPFSEAWSNDVFAVVADAAQKAGLAAVRGDMPVRVTDLTNTVWNALLEAGLVVVECSVPNPNVFYELGLAHALGKDTFILKQRDSQLGADFGGTHYYEYRLDDLPGARATITDAFSGWLSKSHAPAVAALDRR